MDGFTALLQTVNDLVWGPGMLALLLGTGVFVFHDGGKPVFWALGLLMCLFVGPAQSASRSFLARLIPDGMSGEIFGLYATTGRAVSFLSPLLFGVGISIGQAVLGSSEEGAQYWGILGNVVVLLLGLIVAIFVKQPPKAAELEATMSQLPKVAAPALAPAAPTVVDTTPTAPASSRV